MGYKGAREEMVRERTEEERRKRREIEEVRGGDMKEKRRVRENKKR